MAALSTAGIIRPFILCRPIRGLLCEFALLVPFYADTFGRRAADIAHIVAELLLTSVRMPFLDHHEFLAFGLFPDPGFGIAFTLVGLAVFAIVGISAQHFSNIARESKLFTDESRLYIAPGKDFAEHSTVVHSAKEYARGEVHTNTVEGFFSIFKRGMRGVYQHCQEKHLHR